VSAGKPDVHGVFARSVVGFSCLSNTLNLFVSLVLMTYISVVLLLSGYQADEQRMLKGYEEIISK